uniref:Dipeptidyl peptidase 3 n=1 Tax=Ditylenchus dipsaci TaxID=166011 RepID=A0A915D4X9_9BILA
MSSFDKSLHLVRSDTPILLLECKKAFEQMTLKEKLYAYHLAQASFNGSFITFCQKSPESPILLALLLEVFREESFDSLKSRAEKLGWTPEEFDKFLLFVSAFYYDAGNFFGFGSRKFVPDVQKAKLDAFLQDSEAFKVNPEMSDLYSIIGEEIFNLDENKRAVDFPQKGVTGILSSKVTEEDTDLANRFFKSISFEAWNTRLEKVEADNKKVFKVHLASVNTTGQINQVYEFEGVKFEFVYGDYSLILKRVVEDLEKAKPYARDDNQSHMLTKYIEHFVTGDLDAHKDGSRYWIKDKGPVVESYIGFIENYTDPAGVRSEFEGFVAVVDKVCSEKFQRLVDGAEEFLKELPWGSNYEKDTFLRPDFTALDIVAFSCGGIPCGINIPNYDEIRQNEGFKNVSLSNVMSASPNRKIEFLNEEDNKMYRDYYKASFEVQVGLHELLGHGSGKLFQKDSNGEFNFDKEGVLDLFNGKPVDQWYEPGETYSSKFGALSSAFEECRAEAVGYFLCCYDKIVKVFGYETQEEIEKVRYVNWLSEIRAGLVATEFFDPKTAKWGQAHCFARYVLFRECLEAGQEFVTVQEIKGEDGEPDLLFSLDESKIQSVGKPTIGDFLKKLQNFKSSGNSVQAAEWFNKCGELDDKMLRWRDIVVKRRKPRSIFVQSNLVKKDDDSVEVQEYQTTAQGLIQSALDRHPREAVMDLVQVWKHDRSMFTL